MTFSHKFSRRVLLGASAAGLAGCMRSGPVCEALTENGIDWIPDVMRPVSWGIDYLGPDTGAPRRMLIAYPSALEFGDKGGSGAPKAASAFAVPQDLPAGAEIADERPILRHCLTRWPVVLLMHGGDNVLPLEGRHLYWRTMASQLARCGFVVIVPNWNPELVLLDRVDTAAEQAWADVEWVRTQWRHAAWVDPDPAETLFIGHSLGGQVALTLAVDKPNSGVVSLGTWNLPNLANPWLSRVFAELRKPVMFMHARQGFNERLPDQRWAALPGDKYHLTYAGDHFDYMDLLPYVPREAFLPGPPEDRPRACTGFNFFATGLVSLFAARYLRTETTIPPSLEPPAVTHTPAQRRYTPSPSEWTIALDISPGCTDTRLRWVVEGQTGARTLA